ncbi:oxygenase MpaB family protein [Novosphingobium aquiterrae]|uniref:Oxygenase MpaB family protein n=1 Tax=Novosphingobium aquiterrae TaxID=624388 RepID=A0ABV6PH16_9SPHN
MGVPQFDFRTPPGEAALCAPDSISWRVFKNPIALAVGGVAAVLLEFADPRVRDGVWHHSTFPTDPLARMRRTGMAAMATIYGAQSRAAALIADVGRMHARVAGTTSEGSPYKALDRELLDWVQATATFGFTLGYATFCADLSTADIDRAFAEARAPGRLYGAIGAPHDLAGFTAMKDRLLPGFRPSPIVFEFLDIMDRVKALPAPLRPLQRAAVRGGIAILPPDVRAVLELGPEWDLTPGQRRALRWAGRAAEMVVIPGSPAAQAAQRLGLPRGTAWKAA